MRSPRLSPTTKLTALEQSVLDGMMAGRKQVTMARLLKRPLVSVNNATRRVYNKLGAMGRVDAVRITIEKERLCQTRAFSKA